jgi:predicted DCC family thiol-disulfide oxidoreductase YuxK
MSSPKSTSRLERVGAETRPLLVYDGDCGFCTWFVNALSQHLPRRVDLLPWQLADLGALGLTERNVETALQWIAPDERQSGHRAVAAWLQYERGLWQVLGNALITPPIDWVAAGVYRTIAVHRQHIPGPWERRCGVTTTNQPPPATRERD